jgi:hypothetical protein
MQSITTGAPRAEPAPGSADEARYRRYAEARAFAGGDQWATPPRRGEARLTFNYARAVVRKTAAYVFPAPVTFRAAGARPEEEAGAAAAERALSGAVAALDLGAMDVSLRAEAATIGDAAVKVTWDAGAGAPVVAAVDPATLSARSASDRPRQVQEIAQRYGLPPDRLAALGWLRDAHYAVPDRLLPVIERWTSDRWRVEVAGQIVRDGENPYGWIPYVLLPNDPRPHDPWGRSDLEDLYDACREINSRISTLSRILDLSGAPIAVLENVDGSDGIAVRPGATWELPEGARAYLLDLLGGGGVQLHVQALDLLFRALHDLSETPRTAFGDSGRNLSGAALEVEVQPLLQKVARKRRGWDAFYRERNLRLLDLLERFGGEPLAGWRRMEAIWPSVLPGDLDGQVRNAALLVERGIHSRRTAVASLGGDDPEGEFRKVLEEQAMSARGMGVVAGEPGGDLDPDSGR